MNTVFIAGCGYIGERVARLLRQAGADIICMTRSEERAALLAAQGFASFTCSLDGTDGIPPLDVAGRTLFYFVPPQGGGSVDLRARAFCTALAASTPPARIVYMSATSVYGACDGSVVTEDSPATPTSAMGKRRLDAESCFLQFGRERGVPVCILRVSGIYGPGRLPLTQIHRQEPLLRLAESGPSNRIHADDLAQICIAAAEKGEDGEIFNVSDGSPSSMTEYFNAVADALGLPRQPQVSLEEAQRVMSPLMLSYVRETRIVDSSRMIERLGVRLRYPTLEEGLAASLPTKNESIVLAS